MERERRVTSVFIRAVRIEYFLQERSCGGVRMLIFRHSSWCLPISSSLFTARHLLLCLTFALLIRRLRTLTPTPFFLSFIRLRCALRVFFSL